MLNSAHEHWIAGLHTVLELLYFASGIFIATAALLGLRQLKTGLDQIAVTKEVARTNTPSSLQIFTTGIPTLCHHTAVAKKSKAVCEFISLQEAKAATSEARKARGRSKPTEVPGVKNVEVFNRWLKETYPEIYKKAS
jgi:hypothetical protein